MTLENEMEFLKRLRRNNNRPWFERNKPKYLEAKANFEAFVAELLLAIGSFDRSVAGLDPRKLIFRIYRDVRFSKDKRPYKTNIGASISASGKGIGRPGYYLHIEPGGRSIVAGGLYGPVAETLAKVRQEIDYNGNHLASIMRKPAFRKLYGDFWDEDALKTAPKGYPRDHKHIAWLRLKSFIVIHEFSDREVVKPAFLKKAAGALRVLKPLNDFLAEAIEET